MPLFTLAPPPAPWEGAEFRDVSALPDPLTVRGWKARADVLSVLLNKNSDAERALLMAEKLLDAEPSDQLASTLGMRVSLYVHAEHSDLAEQCLAKREEVLRQLGREPLADVESKLGLELFGTAAPGALDKFVAEFEIAETSSNPEAACIVAGVLIGLLMQTGQLDEALKIADRVLVLVPSLSDSAQRHTVEASVGQLFQYSEIVAREQVAEALLLSAAESGDLLPAQLCFALKSLCAIAARQHDYSWAAQLAQQWAAVCFTEGVREGLIEAWLLSASYLSQADDDAAAADLARLALGAASDAPRPTQRAIQFVVGQYLLWSKQGAESAACFASLHKDELASGSSEGSLSVTLLWYARAAEQAQDLDSAQSARREAIKLGQRSGNLESVAGAALDATMMCLAADSPEASDYAELAVQSARELGLPGLLLPALEHRGRARAMQGNRQALGDFDEAIGLAVAHDQAWFAADSADSKGRFLAALGEADEAVRVLLTAADDFTAAGDDYAAAMSELAAARCLREADRDADVLVAVRFCLDRLASLESSGQADLGSSAAIRAEFGLEE